MASGSNMDIEGATQHLRDILKLDRPGNSAGKLPGRGAANVRPRRDDAAQRWISVRATWLQSLKNAGQR